MKILVATIDLIVFNVYRQLMAPIFNLQSARSFVKYALDSLLLIVHNPDSTSTVLAVGKGRYLLQG